MELAYSYKWYLQICKENGLDAENHVSKVYLSLAKEQSKKMKYFMEALERYKNSGNEAPIKIQQQIEDHNNRRIAHMLDALNSAERQRKNES